MKATYIFVLLACFAMLFWYCKPASYTAENLPSKSIKWGNGGGIVGKEVTYMLFDNGQIFKMDGVDATPAALKKVKGKSATALFEAVTNLNLAAESINEPGNVYNFLELKNDDGTANRMVWGKGNDKVSSKLADMVNVLNQLITD